MPCGFTGAALPIGPQLVGRPSEEPLLLRIGVAFEAETRWCKKAAPAFGVAGWEAEGREIDSGRAVRLEDREQLDPGPANLARDSGGADSRVERTPRIP